MPACSDSAPAIMYPPRPSARVAGSAASPRTNPLRSNNDRDRDDRSERRRSYDTNTPYDRSAPDSGSTSMELQGYDDQESEYMRKLNQIIQVRKMHTMCPDERLANVDVVAILCQRRLDHCGLSSHPTTDVYPQRRHSTEQMGAYSSQSQN